MTRPSAVVIPLAVLLATLPGALALAQNGAESEPSVRITGRVVDAAGNPVLGADVKVRLPADPERDGLWSSPFPSTDEHGRFEILAPEDSPFDLAARADGQGTAYAQGRFDQDSRVEDLVLRGEGRLLGSVRFPSGQPVRGLYLTALSRRICETTDGRMPVELDGNGRPRASMFAFYPSWEAWRAERDDGLLQAHAETDDEGRFEFRGLAPGEFLLHADCLRVDRLLEDEQGWLRTGNEPRTLVADLHRVRFRLQERDGSPFEPRVSPTWIYVGPPYVHRLATLSDGRRLIDGSIATVDDVAWEVSLDNWLEPGAYYARTNFDQGRGLFGEFTPSETFFEVPFDRDEIVVEMTRIEDSALEPGRVQVSVTGDTSSIPPMPFSWGMLAGVMDEAGRMSLVQGEPGEPDEFLELPPGRYLVGGGPAVWHFKRGYVLGAGACWKRVEVRAGETVTVEIGWTPPGSLRLTLDPPSRKGPTGDFRGTGWPASEIEWKRSVTSWLAPRDVGPVAQIAWKAPGQENRSTMRLVPPIAAESLDAHAPGSYDLVVWREGLEPIVTPVEIRSGEMTEVRVVVPEPGR